LAKIKVEKKKNDVREGVYHKGLLMAKAANGGWKKKSEGVIRSGRKKVKGGTGRFRRIIGTGKAQRIGEGGGEYRSQKGTDEGRGEPRVNQI